MVLWEAGGRGGGRAGHEADSTSSLEQAPRVGHEADSTSSLEQTTKSWLPRTANEERPLPFSSMYHSPRGKLTGDWEQVLSVEVIVRREEVFARGRAEAVFVRVCGRVEAVPLMS